MYPKNEHDVPMTPAAKASGLVNRMISNESHGPNGMVPAMRRIARDYGLSFNTLEYLRKGRAKTIEAGLFQKIRAAYLAHCEFKLRSLAHEIQMERACGNDFDEDILSEAETLLAKIEARKS